MSIKYVTLAESRAEAKGRKTSAKKKSAAQKNPTPAAESASKPEEG